MTATSNVTQAPKKKRSLNAINEQETKLKAALDALKKEKRAALYEDRKKKRKKRDHELYKLAAAFDTLGIVDIGYNRALFLLHEALQKYDLTNKAQFEDLFKKGERLKEELDANKTKHSTG